MITTVGELIEELQKKHPDGRVEVEIHQWNKRYPIAYETIIGVSDMPGTSDAGARLMVVLGDGIYLAKRKKTND